MEKSKLIKKIDNQIYFKVFLALLWSKEILLDYVRGFLLKIPGFSVAADYLIPSILFLMFLLSYKTIAERLRGPDFVFVMSCIVVYVGSYLLYKRNRDFFAIGWMDFILGSLPFYFVGVALGADEDNELVKWLYRISCVSVISFAVYIMFINEMESVTLRAGDMNSAYNILPHVCLTYYYLIKEFRWRRLLPFLVGVISMLMMGTRGAVLCLLVFIVLATAITIRFQKPIVLLCMTVICLLFVFFHGLTDLLVQAAYSIGERFGLSTRIFDKALSGEFGVSAARSYLRQRVLYYIQGYAVTGLGIYGDRVVSGGQYVHNLFLEIYVQFGALFGTLLSVALVVLGYRGIRYVFKNGNENSRLITLLLLSFCFKLLVSSSYLRDPFFWLMIGYFVAVIRMNRNLERTEEASIRKSKFVK